MFVADNNENNTETTIYRFYVLTNYSNKGQLSNEYYPPKIILDYSQKYTHWTGPAISGLCINYDDESLYWASPSEHTIYKNKYGED